MAIVRPFRGLRPKADKAKQVASPPYDVLNTEEAREMARNNPYSFLRVNKAELEFDDGTDVYGEEVYNRAKENLRKFQDDGVMVRDPEQSFYLYRLTMNNRSQTGLVALTSVDEYDRGIIKKHEHIRPDKMNDRATHIQHLNAQVGPVLSTFRHSDRIRAAFNKITGQPPKIDFVADDNVRHELWVVDNQADINEITAAFAELKELYIADGHHRSAAASEVCRRMKAKNLEHTGNEKYNYFMNVLFPDDELHILPYNRVVADLNGLSLDDFLTKVGDKFSVAPHDGPVEPEQPHRFGMYSEKHWYALDAGPGTFDETSATKSIDASILQENLIAPVLGIQNPKTDSRIDFVGGIRGTAELVRLVDSGKYKLAFSLYPTTIEQLLNVADAGEVMPPKSTWFEPKLRSGMVVNLLTD